MSALYFDGIDDYLYEQTGVSASLGLTTWTHEAWIWLDAFGVGSSTSVYAGFPIVARGYNSDQGNYWFGVHKTSYKLIATFENAAATNFSITGTRTLERYTWYHVAYTYDGTTARLYVNGVLDASATHSATPDTSTDTPFGIGVAKTASSEIGRFHGYIKNVRVWNAARDTTQLASSATTEAPLVGASGLVGEWPLDAARYANDGATIVWNVGVGGSDNEPIETHAGTVGPTLRQIGFTDFRTEANPPYVLDTPASVTPASPTDYATVSAASVPLQVTLADAEANANTVQFWGRAHQSEDDFAIVTLPDTQNTNEDFPLSLQQQFQWIAANATAMNLKAVLSLGDCVNFSTHTEWTNYSTCVGFLEVPQAGYPEGIPYGHCVGNHDTDEFNQPETSALANVYFGADRFAGRSYYGGHYDDGTSGGNDNDNNFTLFSAGGLDFISVSTEFDFYLSRTDQIAWVRSTLQAYPNRIAIVVSHYLLGDGNPGYRPPQSQALYDAIKDLPNVILMCSGHLHEACRKDTFGGHDIYTIMADYQWSSTAATTWNRHMLFKPRAGKIHMRTHNTSDDTYALAPLSDFEIPWSVPGAPEFELLGTVSGVPAGGTATLDWDGRSNGHYEWFARSVNGPVSRDSAIQSFTVSGVTMGTLSTDLRNRLLNHTFGVATYASPSTVVFAAYVAGTEVTGGSYARKSMSNNTTTWLAAAGRAKTNGVAIPFVTATAGWGTIDEIRCFNGTTGDEMFRHTLDVPVAIANGQTLNMAAGAIDITAPSGSMSDAFVHKCLDLAFGATSYTAEATTQFAYFAGDPQGAGTEITGTGYTRDTNTSNGTTWAAASGGAIQNAVDFGLGTAGGSWTTATHCALFNNAGSGLMLSAALPVARSVLNGETETVQTGRIRPQLV